MEFISIWRNDNNEEVVYVGQHSQNGESVLFRVTEHLKDKKNIFSDAVILTTQNNSFGPTEVLVILKINLLICWEIEARLKWNENEPNAGNVTGKRIWMKILLFYS